MPVYNTDLLAPAEVLIDFGANASRIDSDTEELNGGSIYRGTTEFAQMQAMVTVAYGFSARADGFIQVANGAIEQSRDLAGPSMVELRARNEGWNDVVVGAEYLLIPDARTPMVLSLAVMAPSASDYPGTAGVTINGVQTGVQESGGMGNGYTQFFPRLSGSVKGDKNALEWELSWLTDDEKVTEDAYMAKLSWLHHFNQATYIRLGGDVYFQKGSQTAIVTTNDRTNLRASLSLAHIVSNRLKLAAGYDYGQPSDSYAVTTSGNTVNQSDPTLQAGSLSLEYLFQ